MYSLGIDIGSSSVKVSVLNTKTGVCEASAFAPEEEMKITAVKAGWAEQEPEGWWVNFLAAFKKALSKSSVTPQQISAIGISYQMHGLVALDKDGNVVRPSIIWCDSRAVELGNSAFKTLGKEYCLSHLLNSPGNFTASKLKWVKDNEPELFSKIYKIMLPGDYVAYRLSGEMQTTISGLSEGMFWDFKSESIASQLMDLYGFPASIISDIVPTFGKQSEVSDVASKITGLQKGTLISYRAGDQPNNAFSLNVLEPGEVAATAGTSGVIYGVNDKLASDDDSRVNSFAHVNHTAENKRLGVLLCINGTGILNSWLRQNMAGLSYDEMNKLASSAKPGAEGLLIYPFGNGAERVLKNQAPGATIKGLSFNTHNQSHLLRAAQEGIAFSFNYGAEIMGEMGIKTNIVRAGKANMFLSPLFRQTMANVLDAKIELVDTDGALGAARGAALGAGLFANAKETFATLKCIENIEPDKDQSAVKEAYNNWKKELEF